MVKPHGFVLDFVGIFDKLEKALAFDSDEVNAIVKGLKLLKQLFQSKMEGKAKDYIKLIERRFDDKDVDRLIEHFRDKGRRKEFFIECKEIQGLYEIISPDAFLQPYMNDYGTLSAMYEVVRAAYAKTVYVDKEVQRKTAALVREHVGTSGVEKVHELLEINSDTIELVKKKEGGATTKVINLIKSIHKTAEEQGDDPCRTSRLEAERKRA